MVVSYQLPERWIVYDKTAILEALTDAKAALLSLKSMPYQRDWVDSLQKVQLKREVAGTSRIEGAEFTEKELDAAIHQTPNEMFTRSQRQAHAAADTYRWIPTVPDDRPLHPDLICEIHRRLIIGADDDHCPPGKFRDRDQNVLFGAPRHRGVEGGPECERAVELLCKAANREFQDHDRMIQALAVHYHLAAMHPFLDGNGRTARALEALFLQRAGLRDVAFIAMSNYYYDEKNAYLSTLASVRAQQHDLTPFLLLGLKGIALQCRRLLQEIQIQVQKALFRGLMYDLFNRLKSPRKRVIAKRQIEILKLLLDRDLSMTALEDVLAPLYRGLGNPGKAAIRDGSQLAYLEAVVVRGSKEEGYVFSADLDWPTRFTETELFQKLKDLPKAKTHPFLR